MVNSANLSFGFAKRCIRFSRANYIAKLERRLRKGYAMGPFRNMYDIKKTLDTAVKFA